MIKDLSYEDSYMEPKFNEKFIKYLKILWKNNPQTSFDSILAIALENIKNEFLFQIKDLSFKKKISIFNIKRDVKRVERTPFPQREARRRRLEKLKDIYDLQNLNRNINKSKYISLMNPLYNGSSYGEFHYNGFLLNINDPSYLLKLKKNPESTDTVKETIGESDVLEEKSESYANKIQFLTEIFKKYNIEILKIQKEMLDLDIIEKPLTMKQINKIIDNPFIKFSSIFADLFISEEEHNNFKQQFSKNLDI
ncbi:MAG: hypothetical protein BAJALOKI2v1_230053 [Promethearchaeota archaeon]|nr:MAG: hypothetical protein BAJALOKI2v1_230053 [Candidatus Lokiarchaeota archaeon]